MQDDPLLIFSRLILQLALVMVAILLSNCQIRCPWALTGFGNYSKRIKNIVWPAFINPIADDYEPRRILSQFFLIGPRIYILDPIDFEVVLLTNFEGT